MRHSTLVAIGVRWLSRQCSVVLYEFATPADENPDVNGWAPGSGSILIECKLSRSDFLKDATKTARRNPRAGMGHRRYYLCPPDLIQVKDLPPKWGLNGAKANYPMALNEDDHRLFVVTRRPPFVVVLDTDTGKEVARVPVGGSCGDVYFDAERKRIYALGGEGFISVVQQNDPDHYALRANIATTVGVRTCIFFGTSLYVGVPAAGLEAAQVWNYGVPE